MATDPWKFFAFGLTFLGMRVAVDHVTGFEWLKIPLAAGSTLSFAIWLWLLLSPLYQRLRPAKPKPTLIVTFDPTNPHRRFWSVESALDEQGKVLGVFWEYRVEVRNAGAKTMRNVSATHEARGAIPNGQQPAIFKINRLEKLEMLHPGEHRMLIILSWPCPPIQAGMMVGEDAYGPLIVSVSADDVETVQKTFRLDYQRTPMIFEPTPNPQWPSSTVSAA